MIDAATRTLVMARARDRCEYCSLPQSGHEERFSIDHVIARRHGGSNEIDNLACCCLRCNLYKGTDLTSIDPATGLVERLFNPRAQIWAEHFAIQSSVVSGLTATGRTTVALLNMNAPERVLLRTTLSNAL